MMRHLHTKKGFTLIEMIVSVGLFSLLMLLIVTAFFYLVTSQRTLDSKQQILNDFRSSLDVMSKEITSGSAFPPGCDNGCTNIIFTTKTRPDLPLRNIEYSFNASTGQVLKAEQTTFGLCAILPFDNNCFQPITSSKVKVSSMKVFVSNKAVYTQPIITVQVQGTILPGTKAAQAFNISSTFTPRLLQDPTAIPPSDNVPPAVTISNTDAGPVNVPPGGTGNISTGNATIKLSGTASDNVGVVEVDWRNETKGQSGIVSGSLTSWTTPDIPLKAGVANTITISAVDAGGNIGTATLIINSTAQIVRPPAPFIYLGGSCGGWQIDIAIQCVDGNDLQIYRCIGSNCAPTSIYDDEGCWPNWNDNAAYIPPGTYTYMMTQTDTDGNTSLPSNNFSYTTQSSPACQSGGSPPPPTPPPPGTPPSPTPPTGTFSLTASPSIITVRVSGSSTTFRQSTASSIRVSSGFGGTVAFSASGAPTGSGVVFNPSVAGGGGASNFFVDVPDNTPIGTYIIDVHGVGTDSSISDVNVVLDVAASGGGQQ